MKFYDKFLYLYYPCQIKTNIMVKPIKWITINNENEEMQFRASYAINHSDLIEDNDPYYPFGGEFYLFTN